MTENKKLTVFYDGACPLCRREIGYYRRRQGAEDISWADVSVSSDGNVATGLSRDQALARFHIMKPDGNIVSGGRAFAELWAALPGFRLLGRLFRKRPLLWLLDRAYDVFLRFRPRLQTMMAEGRARDR
ncbi:MAG: DUF393 domain-containing protein [Methyloceanibacter sp.]|nr:DUF393 domain-containing protein [Methyloceanibacter sp.]